MAARPAPSLARAKSGQPRVTLRWYSMSEHQRNISTSLSLGSGDVSLDSAHTAGMSTTTTLNFRKTTRGEQ